MDVTVDQGAMGRASGAAGRPADTRAAEARPVDARGGDPRFGDQRQPRLPERRTALGHALRVIGLVLFLVVAFVAGSFLHFTALIVTTRPPADLVADGIVVLTGGRDRVQGAIELLEEGRAQRLLISGVHPQTRAQDIQRVTDTDSALFRCCVDLGFKASTTVGNARETADWARYRGFKSLIVVTSAYHMPRSLAELGQAIPDVTLIPFPVKRTDLNLDTWYAHPRTLKLLTAEYVKYMLARLRLGVETMERPVPAAAAAGAG